MSGPGKTGRRLRASHPPAAAAMATNMRRELAALRRRYERAISALADLSSAAEGQVVRWVWAVGGPVHHLDPLYFLDPDVRLGRVSEAVPADPRGWIAYGVSSQERIVAEREYLIDLRGRFYNSFYVDEPDRVIGFRFGYADNPECINCSQLVLGAAGPSLFQRWAVKGWSSTAYVSVEQRIRSFSEIYKDDDEPQKRVTGELRYIEDGLVEMWTNEIGGSKRELSFRGRLHAEKPWMAFSSG